MSDEERVEKGQVYASTHKGDIAEGVRQRRIVTSVTSDFAFLHTEGGRLPGSTGVRLRNGRIPGHRLVAPAPSPLGVEQ